jgi:hypothetical protein
MERTVPMLTGGNTHDELAAVEILPFLHVQSLAKVKQTAHYILIPYESVVKRAEVGLSTIA